MSIHGRACFILCDRQRALYGKKYVPMIFLTNMASHTDGYIFILHIVITFSVTHSTNEDLLNIKRKDDPKSRILSRTSDTTETGNPFVISHFVSLFYLY
jgi:hypothetical protein